MFMSLSACLIGLLTLVVLRRCLWAPVALYLMRWSYWARCICVMCNHLIWTQLSASSPRCVVAVCCVLSLFSLIVAARFETPHSHSHSQAKSYDKKFLFHELLQFRLKSDMESLDAKRSKDAAAIKELDEVNL
jgi:hypothetical protein